MVTCMIRYEIDLAKVAAFEEFAVGWGPVVADAGGVHHGCFLPSEGASDVAFVLFSFPSLAAYEAFRDAFPASVEGRRLLAIARESSCIRRWDRTFLRPAPEPAFPNVATGGAA